MNETVNVWITAAMLIAAPHFFVTLGAPPYFALVFVALFSTYSISTWVKSTLKSMKKEYQKLLLYIFFYLVAAGYATTMDVFYALLMVTSAGALVAYSRSASKFD